MDGLKHPIEKRVMDVTSDDDVKLVVQSILEEQGKIDIVVNNAGAISVGSSKKNRATVNRLTCLFSRRTVVRCIFRSG
jgi:NADP-dependent 3-hydroxy acid dehydrogenase YdfG